MPVCHKQTMSFGRGGPRLEAARRIAKLESDLRGNRMASDVENATI